ncbi:MAG: hypothetical protein JSW62_00605 [Thermoplasmatales archaeon]|nr:MAG: hypothetical protein JSW62_00605 [Thermoplasmatales archaeon]
MKLVKTASGKQTIKMSKSEWEEIGRTAGWLGDTGKKALDGIASILGQTLAAIVITPMIGTRYVKSLLRFRDPQKRLKDFFDLADEQLEATKDNKGSGGTDWAGVLEEVKNIVATDESQRQELLDDIFNADTFDLMGMSSPLKIMYNFYRDSVLTDEDKVQRLEEMSEFLKERGIDEESMDIHELRALLHENFDMRDVYNYLGDHAAEKGTPTY